MVSKVVKNEAFLRRTKIVATLGPATDDPAVLTDMIRAGLDVARINFSHGDRASQLRHVELVRAAARNAGRNIGLLADLAGPKVRIESFVGGSVQLANEVTLLDRLADVIDQRLDESRLVGVEKRVARAARCVSRLLRLRGRTLVEAKTDLKSDLDKARRELDATAARLRRRVRPDVAWADAIITAHTG